MLLGQTRIASAQAANEPGQRRSLRSDLTTSELRQVLASVERDLAAAISGSAPADPVGQFEAVRDAVAIKRQASQMLAEHPAANAAESATGRRGLLQAESHSASLGDLEAAKRLEKLAEQLTRDPSPFVRADAATVRVGLAIERLQNGANNAADDLLAAVIDLQSTGEALDIAALVSFGQAKQALEQYDEAVKADRVAGIIEANFGAAADPQIRSMAQTIIGRGPLVDLQRDRAIILGDENGSISIADWQRTLQSVWRNPQLSTVRLLANVGLELEAYGHPDYAAATYDVLKTAGSSGSPPEVIAEADGVVRAADARAAVLGQKLQIDLPTVSGQPIDPVRLRGRILVIPFWSAQYPASIEPFWDELMQIRDRHEDRVAVLGVNLDTAGFDPAEFLTRRAWDLLSWRAVSDPQAAIINATAQRFGVSSLIYVLLVDGTGKIRKVNLSGEGLTEQVEALLNEI